MSPIHAESMRSTSSVGKTSWNGIVEAMSRGKEPKSLKEKRKVMRKKKTSQKMDSEADAALALALQLEEEEAARQEQQQAAARNHVDEVAQNLNHGLALAAKVKKRRGRTRTARSD